jgi:hypothetical protein
MHASDSHNPLPVSDDARVRELIVAGPSETRATYVVAAGPFEALLAEVDRLREQAAWTVERCNAAMGDSFDGTPNSAVAAVCDEVALLREALREITNWAEAARGHYGIEESSGPGQERTEWDEVQDGLRAAALFAREALEAGER